MLKKYFNTFTGIKKLLSLFQLHTLTILPTINSESAFKFCREDIKGMFAEFT